MLHCSAGIARGYRVRFPVRGKIFFSIPQSPDRLWGPPSILPNRYQGLPPGVKVAGESSWLLLLVPRSGMVELYLQSPIHLHGVLDNQAQSLPSLHSLQLGYEKRTITLTSMRSASNILECNSIRSFSVKNVCCSDRFPGKTYFSVQKFGFGAQHCPSLPPYILSAWRSPFLLYPTNNATSSGYFSYSVDRLWQYH
jgi:hypothetical protein